MTHSPTRYLTLQDCPTRPLSPSRCCRATTTPTANDDAAVTSEDAAVVIDVLANDNDVDGNLDLSSVRIVSDPFAGTVSIDTATGQITYTPDTEVGLLDWFTYEISDTNGATSTALVTVVVTDVNDVPTANDIQVTLAAGAAVDLAVWYNDVDLDGIIEPADDNDRCPRRASERLE